MTEFLAKESVVFRGDNAELLAIPVDLETIPKNENGNYKKIKAIPLTRSQLKNLFAGVGEDKETTPEQDKNIITKYCVEPKLTNEDIDNMPQVFIQGIVFAILSISTGIPQNKIQEKSLSNMLTGLDKNAEKN